MNTCQWSNFDDLLDDPTITAEHCGNPATWISCEPFIGCLTCDVHRCRCAKRIQQEAACSSPDLKPYRKHPQEVRKMVAKREIPATFLPPLMVASTGMVIGATGPAGSNVPRARVPEITMTFDMEKLRETSRKPEQYKPSVPMPNMSFHLALPEGWKFYGVMPLLEPELLIEETGEAGYFVLSQDVCSIFTPPDLTAPFHQSENFKGPAARFTIDVGWYPDGDPKGSYKCVVVTTDGLDYTRWEDHEGNPWAQPPIAEMETRSTAVVWRWMSETVSKIWNEHYRSR